MNDLSYELTIPHNAVLVDNLSGQHHRLLVITWTAISSHTLSCVIQVQAFRTSTPIHRGEIQVAGEVSLAEAATGAAMLSDVIAVDQGGSTGVGILA